MKKLIGLIIVLLTLILSVIYRQLSHRPLKEKPAQAYVPEPVREDMLLTCLLLQ
ncbi:hypothetical protein [Puia dinghuensis]|uniref:Uncharacterized protein n=1 Tax=Puia dinghuensis TaxID=1792502 RepID=A0A8J2UG40_9BACT|nr:hypothetical protein [Puia dinghuensis]GGB13070.1 hypothetical protein GCM10011511_40900 [Puia dinghuensis]